MVQKLETLGVNAISSSSREAMVYTAEVVRGDVEEVLEVLADSVTSPLLLEEDIQEQKVAVGTFDCGRWPSWTLPAHLMLIVQDENLMSSSMIHQPGFQKYFMSLHTVRRASA